MNVNDVMMFMLINENLMIKFQLKSNGVLFLSVAVISDEQFRELGRFKELFI